LACKPLSIIYTGLSETLEVNLNGDDKRFWLGRLENINDNKINNSMSLNPEFFAERLELNDDYVVTFFYDN